MQLVNASVLVWTQKTLNQDIGDFFGMRVLRRDRETGPALLHRTMPEIVVGKTLVPGHIDQALLPFLQQFRPQLFRHPDHVCGISSCQTSVTCDDEYS